MSVEQSFFERSNMIYQILYNQDYMGKYHV